MAAAVMLLALAACSEDKKPEEIVEGTKGPITVESVINEPKVGAPGDTLLFTAVVTSSADNENDFPVYEWTADGGTFVEDNTQTVHWIAPATSGIYTVTAKVTNDVNSATNSAVVFTGGGSTLIDADAGQIDLIGGGPDFHFFETALVDFGVDVSQSIGGVVSDAIVPPPPPPFRLFNAINVVYSAGGGFVANAADSFVAAFNPRPRHIYVGDFAAGTQRRIDIDGAKPGSLERNVFNYPAFSPNGQVVAYQGMAQAWDGVTADSFHVYTYDLVANKRRNITHALASPRAWHPTFSTDGKWFVYVMDKNRNGQYELYGSPMTGNTVDANPASAVQLTTTGGQITSGSPAPNLARPVMAWNPVASILAIVAADNTLYLVQTTATGSTVIPVDTPRPAELIWSADGSMLAASTGASISTVTAGGAVTVRVEVPAGDIVRDMAFSPDAKWLVYRQGRGGGNWIAAADLGAGKLNEPVPITPTTANGQVTKYRGVMSLKPAWTSTNVIIYPAWGISADNTPSLLTRDLSGLVN
jgi:hypothetical protein